MRVNLPELKGKIKVGDKVEAISGEQHCGEMYTEKQTEVTSVSDENISFGGCTHRWAENLIFNLYPKEKTWDNLATGDELTNHTGPTNVLGVLGDLVFISGNSDRDYGGYFYTKKHLQGINYTIVQPEPDRPNTPREVTMADVVAKFGEEVVIKKE